MPDLPVAPSDPEAAKQQAWIRDQLNPANAAFYGTKYQDEIKAAGIGYKRDLAGFGMFDFVPGEMGTLDAKEQTGVGSGMGEEYRKATLDALRQANLRGMQNSRMADEAVGIAWSRLNRQKQDFFDRYATTVNGSLQKMQSERTALTTTFLDLYGADAGNAVDNPIIATGPNSDTIQEALGTGAPAAPTKPGNPNVLWKGTVKPKMGVIAKRQGVTPAQLQRKTRGGGKGYVVTRK
jgi:hypothetical protein